MSPARDTPSTSGTRNTAGTDDPRVAVVAVNVPPGRGGLERMTWGLASHAWPASTTVLCPPHPDSGPVDAIAPFEVRRLPLVRDRFPRWAPCRDALGPFLSDAGADVVVCMEWWPAARAAAALRGRNDTLTITFAAGTDINSASSSLRTMRSLRTALGASDVVIAISGYTAGALRKAGYAGAIDIVNPGVELNPPMQDVDELRRRLDISGRPTVLTVARLIPRKGHVEFARQAWPRVRAAHPEAVWLVAGTGPCAEELAAVGDPSIRLLGAIEEATLHTLYAAADLAVLPGRAAGDEVEGFGMVVVEAGVAGTPTIATDVGGTAEAMGGGGVLVAPGEPGAIGTAVADLLGDEAHRHHLGSLARARAEQLDWPTVAARFREIVEDRRSHRSGAAA
jgi:phosphatidylinositol alpha-1,6-mannosyltransferase